MVILPMDSACVLFHFHGCLVFRGGVRRGGQKNAKSRTRPYVLSHGYWLQLPYHGQNETSGFAQRIQHEHGSVITNERRCCTLLIVRTADASEALLHILTSYHITVHQSRTFAFPLCVSHGQVSTRPICKRLGFHATTGNHVA